MDLQKMIALLILLVGMAAVAIFWLHHRKTNKLKSQFGAEYDRAVEQEGNARRGEASLDKRQKKVAKYVIRPLNGYERDRFVSEWRAIQEHFVDDPRGAVVRADRLVTHAMGTRGYPMSDFESQAADLSVDHPTIVGDYRIAHGITVRSERGHATTEDLRIAVRHYRSLFEEIAEGSAQVQVYR